MSSEVESFTYNQYYHDARKDTAEAGKERLAWKSDLKSMRLTCSAFANIYTINAALFYDFYLYISAESLTRLQELTGCPRLSQFVQRVVFMCPQLANTYHNRRKLVLVSILVNECHANSL